MRLKFKITIIFCLLFIFTLFNFCYSYWEWPVNGGTDLDDHDLFTSEFGPNDPDYYEEYAYRFHDSSAFRLQRRLVWA